MPCDAACFRAMRLAPRACVGGCAPPHPASRAACLAHQNWHPAAGDALIDACGRRYSNGDDVRGYFTPTADGARQLLLVSAVCGRIKHYPAGVIDRGLNPARDLVDPVRSTPSAQALFDSVCGGPHRPSRAGVSGRAQFGVRLLGAAVLRCAVCGLLSLPC